MAGIGVKLNKIYEKNTLTTNIFGMGYSLIMTITPMLVVIAALIFLYVILGFSNVNYYDRELFSHTILYIFVFALLMTSPFNSVISKYLSDIIYQEKYSDIMACYYVGLMINIIFASIPSIIFCIHEIIVGGVPFYYVFTSYSGYLALVLCFYSMLYLSICKEYGKISLFYLFGMILTMLLGWFFNKILHFSITYSMLLAIVNGLILTASLEYSLLRSYFKTNSGNYKEVLYYFKKYWQLIIANSLYSLGLFIHNFVFWTTPMHVEVANSFVSTTSYDMASCLGVFTNISASVIFISRVEMYFHERYKLYSEAVIGGRAIDIDVAKKRMFSELIEQIRDISRIQFIISLIIFFLAIIFLPRFGFGGEIIRIFPSLSAGYYIIFLMYSQIIFLYYFDDLNGSIYVTLTFCLSTLVGAIFSSHLSDIFFGAGLIFGSIIGFILGYCRLSWLEKNLDEHIFCRGNLMIIKNEAKPSFKVYDNSIDNKEFR